MKKTESSNITSSNSTGSSNTWITSPSSGDKYVPNLKDGIIPKEKRLEKTNNNKCVITYDEKWYKSLTKTKTLLQTKIQSNIIPQHTKGKRAKTSRINKTGCHQVPPHWYA